VPAMPPLASAQVGSGLIESSGLVESSARILLLRSGFYVFNLLPPDRERLVNPPSSGTSSVEICAAPGSASLRIAKLSGGDDPWLPSGQAVFVSVPAEGATALLTGFRARAPEAAPIEVEVRRLDRNNRGDSAPPIDSERLVLGLMPQTAAGIAGIVQPEARAVLRGAGEVRFLDAEWIGRLGRGLSIESFSLFPRAPLSAPIEYKALTADGEETAWTASGAACAPESGTAPLIGFSLRQVPGSRAPIFDCEYSGYFQSGAISGPARNGAPCLSPTLNDPLEGMRVRMVPRLPRTRA
jgi:hypothetical protein